MSERRNILTDPQSSRVKRVAGLFRRSSRNRHGRYLAEGPQAVREAIKYVPEQVLDLYLTEAAGKRTKTFWKAPSKQTFTCTGSARP